MHSLRIMLLLTLCQAPGFQSTVTVVIEGTEYRGKLNSKFDPVGKVLRCTGKQSEQKRNCSI